MNRTLTCIICPKSCTLCVDGPEDALKVTGFRCPKGQEYAFCECLHPVRTVTALVRIANRENTMVSVKTETPVPKEHMMDVIEALRPIRLNAPIAIGTVVLEEIYGTRIVVTKNIP